MYSRLSFPLFWLLLISTFLISCSCSTAVNKTQIETVTVQVRKPARVDRAVTIAASGTVEAGDAVDIAFQVAGRIARVIPDEGSFIRKGELLAQIDATDYNLGAEAAQAQTAMARANHEKARAGARAQELEQARIAYERAADEHRRMRILYERKSLAPNDFRKFEAAWQLARERYDEAKEGARGEDKAAALAALEQAQAAEKIARKRVADTALYAPLSGFIARRGVDVGETVPAGAPVFTIMNVDPAKVRVGIPETDVSKVRVGQRANVSLPALPQAVFTGRVTLIGVAADPMSRTYTAKIEVPNRGHSLRPGMIAEAQIESNVRTGAITLPGQAISRDPQGVTIVFLYFPDQQRAHMRRVETGTVYGNEVEIRSGLTGDELVVVAGQQKLREGSTVRIVGDAQ